MALILKGNFLKRTFQQQQWTKKEVGFSGFIIDDHVPTMVSNSNYTGRAHATGYIIALVDAVMKLC